MFVRFITSRWDHDAYDARRATHVPAWQRDELSRELRWFAEHLAVPAVLCRATGHLQERNGVCWFRDSAAEHVSRARYVAWLLAENGIVVDQVPSRDPGTTILADDHQIVAVVDRWPHRPVRH